MFGRVFSRLRSVNALDILWWSVMLFGVARRMAQYLTGRSLWGDEASLALNLVERDFVGLTKLLDYHQGAPIGFLFLEKILILTFGINEYVLRFFPLISGILSIYLIYLIARTYIGTNGLYAVLIFCMGWQLIYYSSEVKQYSSDVFILLMLIYQTMKFLDGKRDKKGFFVLGISGVIAMWISHPSAFVLASIGVVLVLDMLLRKEFTRVGWILGLGFIWIGSFAVEYFVSLDVLTKDDYLFKYWTKAFVPSIPPWRNLLWFVDTYFSLLLMSLNTHIITFWATISLSVIGFISLLKRNRNLALLLFFPPVFALVAAFLQKYPLKDRFMLFLVPILLLIISEGVGYIYRFFSRWNRALALVLCILPVVETVWLPGVKWSDYFTTSRATDIKPVIRYVLENQAAEDVVYVYYSGEPAFRYYALEFNIDLSEVIIGSPESRPEDALKRHIKDIKYFAAKKTPRVWFIYSGITYCGCDGDKQAYYVDQLNEYGKLVEEVNAPGTNAYLYDFSQ